MKHIFLVCGVLLAAASGSAEERGFSDGLPASDFKAAGLDKLTSDERARLDALVEAENKRALELAEATKTSGVSEKPVKPEKEIVRGKIAGALAGWEEGSVLVLEDGSRWQVVSKGSYRAAPARRGPKVELFPLANGDYVMTVETVPRRAQVRAVPAKAGE